MSNRRQFLVRSAATGGAYLGFRAPMPAQDRSSSGIEISETIRHQDLFQFLKERGRSNDVTLFCQLLGAANPFKEGDEEVGVAAANESTRQKARQLLSQTPVQSIDSIPLIRDHLTKQLPVTQLEDEQIGSKLPHTFGDLKEFLLKEPEDQVLRITPYLSSTAIGCVVKLMSNTELITVGSKVFNRLPGRQIGGKGYLGARIQPNSPTDNIEDIRWQVFSGWSYAVGDVVLGTNPVSSHPRSVAAIEFALKELLVTFGIEEILPYCVLSHIDVQAEVEESHPGSTSLWFQSIAGTDSANETFDISVQKMLDYASQRVGKFGLYFETGQGADFTNGHGHGFDMVLHESRKYGFARLLKHQIAKSRRITPDEVWVHLNDVAGFIGPEVFRTREQLVRCCLEDIVMGKLHELTIGLDVCSTLHMDVSLDDLDWCLEQIMPANPAYLMALPTKIDPMLGYLTTGYQDHVRIRNRFQYKVDDRVWDFFKNLGVIDQKGQPTEHFGDPLWVYEKYCRRKGDPRSTHLIRREGRSQIDAVKGRGVFVTEGHGKNSWDLKPELAREIGRIYDDAKQSIWAEWKPQFVNRIPEHIELQTESTDRTDYILHPSSGEKISEAGVRKLNSHRLSHSGRYEIQIVISDGLNALSMMERGHLKPFIDAFIQELSENSLNVSPTQLVVYSGRVRAGYEIGERLYGHLSGMRAIVHLIGERPGTGHRTFSAYLTAATGKVWGQPGKVDHNITKVVSGIANTALLPVDGASQSVQLINEMMRDTNKDFF